MIFDILALSDTNLIKNLNLIHRVICFIELNTLHSVRIYSLYCIMLQANEDCNCYSYDARKLEEAKCVHKDHVSAV
jgi:hypothetical protein